MKKIFQLFILSTLMIVGCKKDENRVIFQGGTAPILTASTTDSIPLSFANKDKEAIQLSWTNPEYQFNTGVSSLNVNYTIEIDTMGANFTNPDKQVISIGTDLSRSFTQSTFNDYLLNQLQLVPATPHNIEIRLTSSLVGGAEPLVSQVLGFKVIPYEIPPKVEPPTDNTLWIIGDAVGSGWNNPIPAPYDVSQQFTQVSATVYELTLNMPGGGGYKLIQQQGNWDTQYHMIAGGTWSGGDFEKKNTDPQFPGPPSGGNYKIQVDFQRGKYSVVKL